MERRGGAEVRSGAAARCINHTGDPRQREGKYWHVKGLKGPPDASTRTHVDELAALIRLEGQGSTFFVSARSSADAGLSVIPSTKRSAGNRAFVSRVPF